MPVTTLSIVAQALAAVLIVATLLPFWRSRAGVVRTFDFPRFQIASAIPPVLILLVVAGHDPVSLALGAGLLAALGLQLRHILPFTRLARPTAAAAPVDADPATCVSILIVNVLQSNRAYDRLLRLVRRHDPDLILALETDAGWRDALHPLRARYPHGVDQAQDNTYGLIFYSRLPLDDVTVRFLIERDVPSVRAGVTLPSGERFTFHGVHPRPPHPGHSSATRDGELVLVAREVAREGGPTVVAGDLNDVAWSRTTRLFQAIGGLLDPRVGRGAYPTFHAGWPILRWPLDHVFFSEHFLVARLERLDNVGSDHFPILIRLCRHHAAEAVQEPPAADAEERREGDEAVAEAREAAQP
ncbi:endonuclease/exonuclease/phosphatase family protein [Methylobacterium terricola]|uniref:Endonuclease/exonuclease/phosphatase family protein n=1 Tax=Methylobacterium terricola TaxID=2583531 RepID=A0A5C4L8I3_9HYPH|nr:endonuclease/exonuclease/phosphatase family protein [Methylobacterium terricola]TNC08609.1 endonuclease/exonuclease/phosphatase family protein [Methylobacterium terricola]